MADSTKLLLLAGAGAAVWYFYFGPGVGSGVPGVAPATVPPAGGGGSAPPVTGGGSPPASTGTAPKPPAVVAPAVSTVQARVLAAAGDPAGGLTVDQWGWYLNNELAAAGLPAAPDPMPIFQAATGRADRSDLFSFGQYWGIMSPALRAAPYGLSGFGLGLGLYLRTR